MGKKHKVRQGKSPAVRLPFLIAGAVTLLAFGAVVGIGFDLATRPPPVRSVARSQIQDLRPSRRAPPPKMVVPANPSEGDFLGAESRRAWGSSGGPNGGPGAGPSSAQNPNAEPAAAPEAPQTAFAVPAHGDNSRPEIAIVIDDVGVDHPRALQVIALAAPLTLSLMTYADDLPDLAGRARAAGHELFAHVPMEPRDKKENPGPGALLTKMGEDAIRKQLGLDLDGWSGYVGVNNHMGSKFTADRADMAVIMTELKSRGLMWFDFRTIGDTAGPAAARAAGVPYITRDVFLDNVEREDAIRRELDHTVAIARKHGTAIAIGHPHDATIAALKAWLSGLDATGVALVPATEILRRRQHDELEEAPS